MICVKSGGKQYIINIEQGYFVHRGIGHAIRGTLDIVLAELELGTRARIHVGETYLKVEAQASGNLRVRVDGVFEYMDFEGLVKLILKRLPPLPLFALKGVTDYTAEVEEVDTGYQVTITNRAGITNEVRGTLGYCIRHAIEQVGPGDGSAKGEPFEIEYDNLYLLKWVDDGLGCFHGSASMIGKLLSKHLVPPTKAEREIEVMSRLLNSEPEELELHPSEYEIKDDRPRIYPMGGVQDAKRMVLVIDPADVDEPQVNPYLRGMRAYLCGAMDRAPDGGVGWRKGVGSWLKEQGVLVFDPTCKPIDIGVEDMENRANREALRRAGRYDEVCRDMKVIRGVDLRMVDITDFLIVMIDLDIFACGTMEELFLANRQKKPVLVICKQGKVKCPDWLFGTLPHEHIFDSWEQVIGYLRGVGPGAKRWYFFDKLFLNGQTEEVTGFEGPENPETD